MSSSKVISKIAAVVSPVEKNIKSFVSFTSSKTKQIFGRKPRVVVPATKNNDLDKSINQLDQETVFSENNIFQENILDAVVQVVYSPELVKEDLKITHTFKCMFEVLTSEIKYLSDLVIVLNVFVLPFTNRWGSTKTDDFFPGWITMIQVHEHLLSELIDASPDAEQIKINFKNNASNVTVNRRQSCLPDGMLDYLKNISGNSAKNLELFGTKLDALEDAFGCYLESGVNLTSTQRDERALLIKNWIISMSRIFLQFHAFLKVSTPFILNFQEALKALNTFKGKDLRFLSKLETNPILRNLKLGDFIIKPIQRVCKYPLLYREITKHALDEETMVFATQAFNKLSEVTDHVNTMIKQNEIGNIKKLTEILSQFKSQTDLFKNQTNCQLKRDGQVTLESFSFSSNAPEARKLSYVATSMQGKSLRALLFQDQLLLCEKSTNFLTKVERLQILQRINLDATWESIEIKKMESDVLNLILTHPTNGAYLSFNLKFSEPIQGWADDLQNISEKIKQRELNLQ